MKLLVKRSNFILLLLNISFVLGYVIIPVIIRRSLWLQYELTFMNRINLRPFADLDNPIHFGLPFSYNLRITHDLCESIGTWHILPNNTALEEVNRSTPRFGRFGPVILYSHGNFASRALSHRIGHYEFLSGEGFEVVAYDYRGFADSPGNVSEVGVVNDTIGVYKYVLEHLEPGAAVYIWGHSLGSAIAIQGLYRILKEQPDVRLPDGLILECPFVNFFQAFYHYPLNLIFRVIPPFAQWITDGLMLTFDSDIKVPHLAVALPILIVHAEYDMIIPQWQGEALYQAANLSTQLRLGKPKCLKYGVLPHIGHNGGFSSIKMKEYLHNFTFGCIESSYKDRTQLVS